GEVELEVGVAPRERQRIDRCAREWCPAKVGVQDHAAGVDDAAQARRDQGPQLLRDPVGSFRTIDGDASALGFDLLTNRVDDPFTAESSDELCVRRLVDQPSYCRQGNSRARFGITYGMHSPTEIRLAGWKR